jgi:hypothetical protein
MWTAPCPTLSKKPKLTFEGVNLRILKEGSSFGPVIP